MSAKLEKWPADIVVYVNLVAKSSIHPIVCSNFVKLQLGTAQWLATYAKGNEGTSTRGRRGSESLSA